MQVVDIIYDKSNLNLGLDHIQHNTTPVSYSNGDLLEYNISKNRFETNIDYKYSCYGVTQSDTLPMHTDEGRNSTIILPIDTDNTTLLYGNNSVIIDKPFVLDTSILHGINGIKGFSFLALDFELVYNDVVEYLKDKTNLYIKYVG